MRRAIGLSLLIHVMIGVFLLVTIPRQQPAELLPPPSSVSMVFEGGQRGEPALPTPQPDTNATPTPPAKPAPPAEVPLPLPPLPPVQQAPPLPVAPPGLPPPPVQQVQPTVVPPAPAPPPPAPPPPPAEPAPEPMPVPAPAPPNPAPPSPTPPPPAPRPPVATKAPPAPRQPDFPSPMNFSLGTPLRPSRPQAAPHPSGSIDLSFGPAKPGPANIAPHVDIDGDSAGPDWRNALSRWVSEHAYYPEQAARNAEQGDAKVHVVAAPSGKVLSVELIGRSGSMWLDLALQSMFRNAHIPPLPSGMTEPMEFNFTMRYIIVRR